MCVIAVCEETRLSKWMAEDMDRANPYGVGLAWREVVKEPNGTEVQAVRWQKGMEIEEALALLPELPLPYIAHFRIPTCGPAREIFAPLCHPFPITEGVELWTEGYTPGEVLFHNGSWTSWDYSLKDLAIRGAKKIPPGSWSDSRAMAWMAHHLGLGILDLINEKIVVFSPDKIQICGHGWTMLADKILVSNTGWRRQVVTSPTPRPREGEKEGDTRGVHRREGGSTSLARIPPSSATPRTSSSGPDDPEGFPESPFDEKGRLVIEVTSAVLRVAEMLHARKDQHGKRLIGKRKIKKFRRAHEVWRMKEVQARIQACQKRLAETSIIH